MSSSYCTVIALFVGISLCAVYSLNGRPKKNALLIIDIQPCFLPKHEVEGSKHTKDGALAIDEGNQVIKVFNDFRKMYDSRDGLQMFDLVVYTQDWHPENSISFWKNHGYPEDLKKKEPEDGNRSFWEPKKDGAPFPTMSFYCIGGPKVDGAADHATCCPALSKPFDGGLGSSPTFEDLDYDHLVHWHATQATSEERDNLISDFLEFGGQPVSAANWKKTTDDIRDPEKKKAVLVRMMKAKGSPILPREFGWYNPSDPAFGADHACTKCSGPSKDPKCRRKDMTVWPKHCTAPEGKEITKRLSDTTELQIPANGETVHDSMIAFGNVMNEGGLITSKILDVDTPEFMVKKATTASVDAYSGLQDAHNDLFMAETKYSGLKKLLAEKGITNAFVGGLATDFCAGDTARDLLTLGLNVTFLEDASRGVTGPTSNAKIKELKQSGVRVLDTTVDAEELFDKDDLKRRSVSAPGKSASNPLMS